MTSWINEYEIAALIIMVVLLLLHASEKKIYTKLSYYFTVILVTSLFTAVLDEIALYTLAHYDDVPLWVNYLVNMLYGIFSNGIYMLYAIYAVYASRLESYFNAWWKKFLLLLPGIFILTVELTTPITGWAFSIVDGVYMHGFAFYVMYGIAALYIAFGMSVAIYNRKKLSRLQVMSLLYFSLAGVICAILIVIYPELLLNAYMTVIGLILVYISMQTELVDSDKMLGTYNNNALSKQIDKAIKENTTFYLIALKVGNVDQINSSLGFENANRILRQIAEYLMKITPGKKVFHLTGVHFVTYLECEEYQVKEYVRQCEDRFFRNFRVRGLKNEVSVPYNITIMRLPSHGENPDEIMDMLNYSFRKTGVGDAVHNCVWIDDKTIEAFERRKEVEIALDRAVRNGNFEVYYQPIISVMDEYVVSAEALVRIRDDEFGMIMPNEFIPIAEENGSIVQITDFVLNSVCRMMKEYKPWENGLEYIEINVSPLECMKSTLPDRVMSTLLYYGIDPKYVNIEVTETATTISPENNILVNMRELIDKGITFALDDYGTGYSNTAQVVALPFKIIKIDKSILWMAMEDKSALSLLRNLIKLLADLDRYILVEGVETAEQEDLIMELGCQYVQGYFYSKPMPLKEFIEYISDESTIHYYDKIQ